MERRHLLNYIIIRKTEFAAGESFNFTSIGFVSDKKLIVLRKLYDDIEILDADRANEILGLKS
jgi:hypothetical protein